MLVKRNFCDPYEAMFLFDSLLNLDIQAIEGVRSWTGNENGRVNKKLYFYNERGVDAFLEHLGSPHSKLLERFRNFDEAYKSPFGMESIGNLERIQIVHSVGSAAENAKGRHLYNFHVDRVNTYKQILLCSEVTEKSGPFQVANIDICRDEAECVQSKIEEAIQLGQDWRSIDSSISCEDFESATGKEGDVFVVDGREPHRAGQISPETTRSVIIFEYMTEVVSALYRGSFS